ncbi:ATP-grasp domain-containing protein [Paenibacillus sp. KN14-4R]|uniref:ATP-grasp domain-containing protein n=1 Tax=Paenibacillus sp. KN14-4R TaxID=3445773 RepID=UPI003FA0B0E3
MQRKIINSLLGNDFPKIFYSNINWEQSYRNNFYPKLRNENSNIHHLDSLQLFLASSKDIVLLREKPDEQHLSYLYREEGIELPQLLVKSEWDDLRNFEKKIIIPYAMTNDVHTLINQSQCKHFGTNNVELVMKLNNKAFVRELVSGMNYPVPKGSVCNSVESLVAEYEKLKQNTFAKRFVIKQPYGSSGNAFYHVFSNKDFYTIIDRIRNRSFDRSIWIIEEWQRTSMCLNAQLLIKPEASRILSITQQLSNPLGIYKGSDLLPNVPEKLADTYNGYLLELMQVVEAMGYQGFLGIDSYIDERESLVPVIEINARMTILTYLYDLREHLINRNQQSIVYKIYKFTLKYLISFNKFLEDFKKKINYEGDNKFIILNYSTVHVDNNWIHNVHIAFSGYQPGSAYIIMKEAERYIRSL